MTRKLLAIQTHKYYCRVDLAQLVGLLHRAGQLECPTTVLQPLHGVGIALISRLVLQLTAMKKNVPCQSRAQHLFSRTRFLELHKAEALECSTVLSV